MGYSDPETLKIAAEFDRREREIPADYYSWCHPANLMMHEQTLRTSISLLHRANLFPLRGLRILDVGCGDGTWLLEFMQWGADGTSLCGLDLSEERVTCAQRRIPQADIRSGEANKLPWADRSFDLVSQFTVFSSILNAGLKRAVAAEMLRVLKQDGAILWFDFRIDNPSNSNVRGVEASEIRELFTGCDVELTRTMLAPPLIRLIAGWSWPLAELLHAIQWLRTHYVGLIRRKTRLSCHPGTLA